MAFLGIGKKKQKKRAEAAQATIDKLISSGQQLSEHNMQTMVFASDGKIDSKEKKLLKKYQKQAGKTARTEVRQEGRTSRTTERQLGRTTRTEVRQEGRTSRTAERAATRAIAYQNGIDPHKWIGETAGHVANAVVGVASASSFGQTGRGVDYGQQAGGSYLDGVLDRLRGVADPEDVEPFPGTEQNNSSMLLIGGAILLLFIMFKK